MAFDDHAEISGGGVRMSTRAPEDALCRFNRGSHVHARLVRVNPAGVAPSEGDEMG